MDLKLTDYDLDITNGALSWVTGAAAVRQAVEMALRTFLGECVYDRNAGVPYLQILFKRGTSVAAVRFIFEQQILAVEHVAEVLELDPVIDPVTRVCTITGRVRIDSGDEFEIEASA